MNLKVFLFKLSVIVYRIAILTLVFLPFTLALIALRESRVKYGFSFFELSFSTALFIGFAIALAVVCYNALIFEKFKKIPVEAYLKSTQKVALVAGVQKDHINNIVEQIQNKRRWKLHEQSENKMVLVRKTVPTNGIITIQKVSDHWEITSEPKYKIWMVDFGRNYRNILELLGILKTVK